MINIKISKDLIAKIGIFLIMYYVYMSPLSKIFIPGGNITSAVLLVCAVIFFAIGNSGKIYLNNFYEKIICIMWLIIAIYIFINNENLIDNLITGGMIQLYLMITFLLFSKEKKSWIKFYLKISTIFVIFHALSTLIFYFNPNLYTNFANFYYSGNLLTSLLSDYRKGYMAGFCSHFSSNGMILGIGILIAYEYFSIKKVKNNIRKIVHFILVCIIFYALILTSKRAIVLIDLLILVITTLIKTSKRYSIKSIKFMFLLLIIILLFTIFGNKIPGMDTIVSKFENLINSGAGIMNGRESLWKIAIDMFINKPLFGYGYGSYEVVSNSLNAITSSAHNYYLQVLSELGLIGFLLYFIVFIVGIIYTICEIKKTKLLKNNENLTYLCFSLSVQIFVILYSLTATSLMYYNVMIPYFVALSITKNINSVNNLWRGKNEKNWNYDFQ